MAPMQATLSSPQSPPSALDGRPAPGTAAGALMRLCSGQVLRETPGSAQTPSQNMPTSAWMPERELSLPHSPSAPSITLQTHASVS